MGTEVLTKKKIKSFFWFITGIISGTIIDSDVIDCFNAVFD